MLTVKNKKFYLDGEEFKIHSGTFHYFRALPEYWEDILLKIKASGLNCVETYTNWAMHEPHKGAFDFSGMLDVERFLQLAAKVGLKVLLRTGPFICAEIENGGLPAWLLKKEYNIRIRCNTEPYMTHLREWFHVLLPKVRPYLDVNGGPIIAMALENEYGSFGDDFSYLTELEKIYRAEGMDCLYFAADGNKKYHLATGRSGNHIVAGMDFGGYATEDKTKAIDQYDPDAPYFVTEYWAGNFTSWCFDEWSIRSDEVSKSAFNTFVDEGISFNIYMIYGGTNFGFSNGADGKTGWMPQAFAPCATSYDYDAAISEWGGYTQRFFDLREAMARNGAECPALPSSPKLQDVGKVALTAYAPLFENMHLGKTFKSVTIESMEEFDQNYGYILYGKTITYDAELDHIIIKGLHDRAHIFLNRELVATEMRGEHECLVQLPRMLQVGDRLEILVENMGRINYGEETYLGDRKGITESVVLTYRDAGGVIRRPGKTLFNWDITTFEMDNVDQVKYGSELLQGTPAFFKGTFKAETGKSCFVHYENLGKGVIYINGFNIGRYWNTGLLNALYVPGALLKEENEIVIFETDGFKGEPVVELTSVCGMPNHHDEIIVP